MSRTVYYDWQGNEIEPPKADPVLMTNADRIRSMSDEELAEKIVDAYGSGGCCPINHTHIFCVLDNGCEKCWLDWLKSPAEEVDE